MNRLLISLLLLCGSLMATCAEDSFPTIRLTPADFEQNSIKQVHWTTNTFAIKWKYTEAGAKKMLAFWEQNAGRKVCIHIGSFTTPPFVAPESPDPVTHSDWRTDWLKRRTDKFMNLGENDAKTVLTGMKGDGS